MAKRGTDETARQLQKRARVDDEPENTQQIAVSQNARGGQLIQSVKRTSGLTAPIMVLSGHAVSLIIANKKLGYT